MVQYGYPTQNHSHAVKYLIRGFAFFFCVKLHVTILHRSWYWFYTKLDLGVLNEQHPLGVGIVYLKIVGNVRVLVMHC